ncbi:DprA-like DNA processing chain A [Rhodobacter phage RcCWillis]|nr:DprA-like DNA processing chain A [Rhodobacter phage RcCWillis]
MKIIVCGGRDFSNRAGMNDILDALHKHYGFTLLVHGAARGADRMAGEWADANGVPCEPFAADWQMHGPRAGLIRNKEMLRKFKPEIVIAFPGGNGTAHMVKIASEAGVLVHQFNEVDRGTPEKMTRAEIIMAQTPTYEGKI